MGIEQTSKLQDNHAADSKTEARLLRSVRLGVWKGLLWRTVFAVIVLAVFGSVLLYTLKRFLATGGALQSAAVLLVTAVILCLLIILSTRHAIALAVNLQMAHLELLGVLSNAIAKRDGATQEHNLRVAVMAVYLAIAVDLDERLIPTLFIGGFLHDVGKIGVPDGILLKPGKLSPEERQEMERHVIYGDEILVNSAWLHGAGRVVHWHHECFDGSGYPEGRKGEEIPAEARLFAIVDVFDALTSDRPYKERMGVEEALTIMERERGTHFDPYYLDAFKAIARTLYSEVVCISPEDLREQGLRLVGKYYAFHAPMPDYPLLGERNAKKETL